MVYVGAAPSRTSKQEGSWVAKTGSNTPAIEHVVDKTVVNPDAKEGNTRLSTETEKTEAEKRAIRQKDIYGAKAEGLGLRELDWGSLQAHPIDGFAYSLEGKDKLQEFKHSDAPGEPEQRLDLVGTYGPVSDGGYLGMIVDNNGVRRLMNVDQAKLTTLINAGYKRRHDSLNPLTGVKAVASSGVTKLISENNQLINKENALKEIRQELAQTRH